jgi:hypothetical protein
MCKCHMYYECLLFKMGFWFTISDVKKKSCLPLKFSSGSSLPVLSPPKLIVRLEHEIMQQINNITWDNTIKMLFNFTCFYVPSGLLVCCKPSSFLFLNIIASTEQKMLFFFLNVCSDGLHFINNRKDNLILNITCYWCGCFKHYS